jgi:hypothetical protein
MKFVLLQSQRRRYVRVVPVCFLLTLYLATITACESHENHESIPHPNEVDGLALRIKREMPPNWSVEKSGNEIIVSRKEPVRTHICVGLDLSWMRHPEMLREFVDKEGVTQPYKIRLRLVPKLDLAEYHRLKAVNDEIKVTRDTVISNREFFEDDAMESFDPSYRELPVYFTEDSSVYVESTLYPWDCIYPWKDASECEQVRLIVDSFFSRYPEAEIDNHFSWEGPPITPAPLVIDK